MPTLRSHPDGSTSRAIRRDERATKGWDAANAKAERRVSRHYARLTGEDRSAELSYQAERIYRGSLGLRWFERFAYPVIALALGGAAVLAVLTNLK